MKVIEQYYSMNNKNSTRILDYNKITKKELGYLNSRFKISTHIKVSVCNRNDTVFDIVSYHADKFR